MLKLTQWFSQHSEQLNKLTLFLLTWSIGWYLLGNSLGCKVNPCCAKDITSNDWMIFFTGLTLLLLPFVSRISFGSFLSIEKELKKTQNELIEHKFAVSNQLNSISNNMNTLTNSVTNNHYYQIPSSSTLNEENETLSKKLDPDLTNNRSNRPVNFVDDNNEDKNIINLLLLRVEMERELRRYLGKRTSVKDKGDNLDLKYIPLRNLFKIFIDKNDDLRYIEVPFDLFSKTANAVIHGQLISDNQYEASKSLGLKVLKAIKSKRT